MVNDPYEIYNQYNDATPSFKTALQSWLTALYTCAASSRRNCPDACPGSGLEPLDNRADMNRYGQVGVAEHRAGG